MFAQKSELKFKHLTTDEGLSQSTVTAIIKDYEGFMWFGTREGLNRYDGYDFKIYKHDDGNPHSLSGNTISDLLEDKNGNLFIGTFDGFDRYERDYDRFTHYSLDKSGVRDIFEDTKGNIWLATENGICLYNFNENSYERFSSEFSDPSVNKIIEDNIGNLWIATENGLNKFNPETRAVKKYKHEGNDLISLAGNNVKTLFKDKKGNIWIGTLGNGVSRYDAVSNSFYNFSYRASEGHAICHNDILSLGEDDHNNIWVGSENGGLTLIDFQQNQSYCYLSDENNPAGLNNNSIYSIYKDNTGNLWIGTYAGGINFLPKFGDKFKLFKKISNSNNTLSGSNVLSIGGDSQGNIWIGTDGYGLNLFNRSTNTFRQFHHNPNNDNSIASDVIFSIVEIDKETIAIAYLKGGFDLYNKRTEKFVHHIPEEGNDNSLSHIHVLAACRDRNNQLWLGTAGGGLDNYNLTTKTFTHYKHDPNDDGAISSNVIISLYLDKENNLWVGTDNGLNMLDRINNRFIKYQNNLKDKKTISNNVVYRISEDYDGKLLIGTFGGGLNFFNKDTKVFTAFTEKDGLPNNTVYGALTDRNGNLWISSNKGISQFNPRTKKFRNYGISDGVQGNEFKPNAIYETADGEMFFGGSRGFNSFYPEDIKDNPYIPPVVITALEIFNQPVTTYNANSILSKQISETKKIVLPYSLTVFSFRYAALNYTLPGKNQYAYKLEGFDKDWNYVKENRSVTYTNLDAGEYVFHVKGSNNDGVWNEKGAVIKIVIVPPFWKTTWFITLLILVGVGSIFGYFRFQKAKARKQAEQLNQIIEERTNEIKAQTEVIIKKNEQEKIQNWITEGIAGLSEVMSKNKSSVTDLARKTLKYLAEYTDGTQGAFAIINNENPDDEHLQFVAKYGVDAARLGVTRLQPGEGLIGSTYVDKEKKIIDNLPDNYIKIESGLGSTSPKNLVLLPLTTDDGLVMGVIELAYMNEVTNFANEFLEKASSLIALNIHAANLSSATVILLQQAKEQTEELRAQEEEMRQNMEELEATQEEFLRREAEFQNEIENLKKQIKSTM